VETASLSEIELGEYCRSKGLYPEQVAQWRQACINGTASAKSNDKEAQAKLKAERLKTKQLEKELRQKEKALAETAALLVLRKKFNALWEDDEVD
ncbi:IS3 family transposase, partial [Photobacterium sp. SDRW27]|nr:IS3 family transposase [Photobacterium obscurum]